MSLKRCPFCNKFNQDKVLTCQHCGRTLREPDFPTEIAPVHDSTSADESAVTPLSELTPTETPEIPNEENSTSEETLQTGTSPLTPDYNTPQSDTKQHKKKPWGVICGVLIGVVIVFGIVYAFMSDALYERKYVMSDLQLRSSQMFDVDFNKIAVIPYGGEVVVYDEDPEWSKVKYTSPRPGSKPLEGYVSSAYLLNKRDFYLLNSIFFNQNARREIASRRVRLAMLRFFKTYGLTGALSEDMAEIIGLQYDNSKQWEVVVDHKRSKWNDPLEVQFRKANDPNSKFDDMLVIIRQVNNHNERRLVYFTFDSEQNPTVRAFAIAPSVGLISNFTVNNDELEVTYNTGITESYPMMYTHLRELDDNSSDTAVEIAVAPGKRINP